METRRTAELQLLLVAAIWGFGFVAQHDGALATGTFLFNAERFLLGALALLPLVLRDRNATCRAFLPGMLCGVLLFAGSSLQTAGVATTDTGRAAFITSFYLILVALGGMLLGERAGWKLWTGIALVLAGMRLLCLRGGAFAPSRGDLLVFASTFFWSVHILFLGRFSARVGGVRTAFWQFLTCSVLSGLVAGATGSATLAAASAAPQWVLYSGLVTIGFAFTLQATAQTGTTASRAAILLSLETVFATIAGTMLLGERTSRAGLAGCVLMLAGTILPQLDRGNTPSPASQADTI